VAGRPKKIIPAGSSELTITVPNEIIAFLEIESARQEIPIGRLVRRSVETHLSIGDRLEKVEADMKEVRDLHKEILSSIDVITLFIAQQSRDLKTALAGGDQDVAETVFGITSEADQAFPEFEDLPFDEEDAR
jgi:small-conductance mechanosensitive channel